MKAANQATRQAGPTRFAASIASSRYSGDAVSTSGHALAGYRASGVNTMKFGSYAPATSSWTNGYTLDRFANVRNGNRANPAFSTMMGSQGQYMAAQRSPGTGRLFFEVPVARGTTVADFRRGALPYNEVKVGTSMSRPQLARYVASGQQVNYTFMSSPLSNYQSRQATNIRTVQAAGAQTNGRITATVAAGPTQRSVNAMAATSRVNTALRAASRVVVPAAVVVDGVRITRAIGADRVNGGSIGRHTITTVADVGGGWSGAAVGGVYGAKAGAVAGTFIGGPVGTAVGAVVGGVGGAIGGSWLGRTASSWFGAGRNATADATTTVSTRLSNSLVYGSTNTSAAVTQPSRTQTGGFTGFLGIN